MSWVAVGVAAVGATSSYMNNQAKKKQETANQMANADAIQYSPWTHADVKMQGKTSGSDMGAILGGGMQGAMIGSQFNKSATPAGGGDSGVSNAMAGQQKMQMPPVGAPQPMPQAPSVAPGMDTASLQGNMPNINQMQANGEVPGSPWQTMAANNPLKKPNMYGY
jgi:hypothetical protein